MSVAAELDLAIGKIDDLLSRLQANTPQHTTSSETTAKSLEERSANKSRSHTPPHVSGNGSPAAPLSSSTQAAIVDLNTLFAKAQLQIISVKRSVKAKSGGGHPHLLAVQVGRVVSVEEIDSVKLYKCLVELSGGVTKQVMAGLKQHIAKDDLLHSLVVVITNLKAAKLAGELSEAMILAAQAPLLDESKEELVKVLRPLEGSEPGDAVFLEGQTQAGSTFPKTLKSDIWKKIVPELKVRSHTACFAEQKLVTHTGPIHLDSSIPDGAGIH